MGLIPRKTPSGTFDPVELHEYLERKRRAHTDSATVADELGIALDRAAYAMSPAGFDAFARHAERTRQQRESQNG